MGVVRYACPGEAVPRTTPLFWRTDRNNRGITSASEVWLPPLPRMYRWSPPLLEAHLLRPVPGVSEAQFWAATRMIPPALSYPRFARFIPLSYPHRAAVLATVEYGVSALCGPPPDLGRVHRPNSAKIFMDLDATRVEVAKDVAKGTYIAVPDHLGAYRVNPLTAKPSFHDKSHQRQWSHNLLQRRGALQRAALADHRVNLRRIPTRQPAPFPGTPDVRKWRVCVDATGYVDGAATGPNSFGEPPYAPPHDFWAFLCCIGLGWPVGVWDMVGAYRTLFMEAGQRIFFGSDLDGVEYLDIACAFGNNASAYALLTTVTMPTRFAMLARGLLENGAALRCNVDDYMFTARPDDYARVRAIVHGVMADFGIVGGKFQDSTQVVLDGFNVDTVRRTIEVPADKARAIGQQLLDLLQALVLHRVDVESLAGILGWARNAAPNLHPPFREVVRLMREMGRRRTAKMPAPVREELEWYQANIDLLGHTTFLPALPPHPLGMLSSDASSYGQPGMRRSGSLRVRVVSIDRSRRRLPHQRRGGICFLPDGTGCHLAPRGHAATPTLAVRR